jgi:hypothetical protein
MPGRFPLRLTCVCLALFATDPTFPQSKPLLADPLSYPGSTFPAKETLSYEVEWRLIYAGDAHVSLTPIERDGKTQWKSKVDVESGGLVSKLFKIEDHYEVAMHDQFCTTSTNFDAMEGKRHREVKVIYDYSRGKASYVERDLVKNAIAKTAETDIPACVADIVGGLAKLRTLRLEPGQNTQLMLSDGKKTVSARIEAQEREQIKTKTGTFNTIRCEAFVFNGVLYARKAQLQVWLTDDPLAIPIQIRARMSFPVGSITFTLEKEDRP